MTSTYLKKIFPMTWKRAKPVPPAEYTISFDTSSQYITNTVTPFDVVENSTAEYNSLLPNRIVVDDGTTINVDMVLADEWTSITGWGYDMGGTTGTMTSGTPITITDDTEFIPTVSHVVIHRDTQGPCPNGFHIGTKDEWNTVVSALDTLGVKNETDTKNYLKLPDAYYLNRTNGNKNTSYGTVRIWTSTMSNNSTAAAFIIDEKNVVQVKDDKPGNAFSIRPFKDSPVTPDSSWTTLYQGTGSAGIFWNSTLGLISISGNGTTWTTMADKNLGATNVLDNGLFYQFGNNTGYTYNASPYVTSKPTLNNEYGPGNYYTGSFVRVSKGNNWFDGTDNNIWGGVTNGTWTE